jgi:hypothetical protein
VPERPTLEGKWDARVFSRKIGEIAIHPATYLETTSRMTRFSTNQVAKKLGIGIATLTRYIQSGKVAAPPETMAGGMRMRLLE